MNLLFTPAGLLRNRKFWPLKEPANKTPPYKKLPPKMKEGPLDLVFWTRGMDCILAVCVTDTDAKSYCKHPLTKVLLEMQEKEKKRKYLENCLKQRRHFTPFIVSVDGLLG
jgi:hypothetical protein